MQDICTLRDNIANSVLQALQQKLQSMSDDKSGSLKISTELTQRQVKKLQECVHNEFNVAIDMADSTAYLPYQEYLSEADKAEIDSGRLTLHELCMHDSLGCKFVDLTHVDKHATVYQNLYIPAQSMYGFSMRHFHALLEDCDTSAIRGDRVNKVHFDTFWDMTSPDSECKTRGSKRFSVISSVLSMRNAAMFKKTNDFGAFVHYDHPQNSLCATPDAERISRCGQLYNGVMSITKAYNAVVCAAYGKPVFGSTDYNEMLGSQFSLEDAKRACAAVVRCYAMHPQKTVELANICYNSTPKVNHQNKHENCKQLYRHITSKTSDEVKESLQLQKQLENKEWSPVSHLENKPLASFPDEFRIGDCYTFPWIEPRNARVVARHDEYFEQGRKVRQRPYSNKGHERRAIENYTRQQRQTFNKRNVSVEE